MFIISKKHTHVKTGDTGELHETELVVVVIILLILFTTLLGAGGVVLF